MRSKSKNKTSNAEYKTAINITAKKQPKLLCRFENKSQIPRDLSGIDVIIYPLEKEPIDLENIIKIVDIPRGIVSEKAVAERLKLFKENRFNTALCGNLSAVEIAKKHSFNIIADTGLNIFNSESVKKVEELGLKAVTLSYELSLEESRFASNLPKGIIAYGNVPLMTFKNCPVRNGKTCKECDKKGVLRDRLGTLFPVRCRMGYSEMLNSVPIWLADKQPQLTEFDFIILYFTNESRERVETVITAYKNGASADTKYTRGLYFRGVI